ncbi:hypothetical protein [Mycolicibacterium sp. CR10]|uniref:hypothetical protein n=1 Tax=Mycolicibacterium sp. CR10 TaxID=2562314 RepID=UPI0010C0FDDA|nr:hypothetical protein [Mycolicibacterium sp. CR10]
MSDNGMDEQTLRRLLDAVRDRLAEMDSEVDFDADPTMRPLRALLRVQDAMAGAGYAAALGDEEAVVELLAVVARWSVVLLTETPVDEEGHDALTLVNGIYGAAVSGEKDALGVLAAVDVDELGSSGLVLTPMVSRVAAAVSALAAGRPVQPAPPVPDDTADAYWALQAVAAAAYSHGDEPAAEAALDRLSTVHGIAYATSDLEGTPARYLRLPERGLRALGRRARPES